MDDDFLYAIRCSTWTGIATAAAGFGLLLILGGRFDALTFWRSLMAGGDAGLISTSTIALFLMWVLRPGPD
jgi:hypothetical protein